MQTRSGTPRTEDPAVQRRRLRVELRTLRKEAGQTQRDVARAMDWSVSKVIRIENGDVSITPSDLRALAAYYELVDQLEVERLVSMARLARRNLWSEYREVHSQPWLTYLAYESSASLIRTFEPALVPGLLQTEEYAHAIFATSQLSKDVADKRWELRLRRQELHDVDDAPEMFFIVDEAVVRRAVGGPGVMRRQLQRIVERSELEHVSVRVLPFSVGAHPLMTEPLLMLEFPDPNDDDLVYLERPGGDAAVREEADATAAYVEQFMGLEDLALSDSASRGLLDALIHDSTAFAPPIKGGDGQ